MITDAELDLLRATKNESEWNAACDTIRKNHAGTYPADWGTKVLVSGLASQVSSTWL
jgi:hypothetical protein